MDTNADMNMILPNIAIITICYNINPNSVRNALSKQAISIKFILDRIEHIRCILFPPNSLFSYYHYREGPFVLKKTSARFPHILPANFHFLYLAGSYLVASADQLV